MILLLTVVIFIAGFYFDKITISTGGYVVTFFAAFIGGAVYLGLGQLIVGLLKNAETVNSTTRLVYFVFIMVGTFGETGLLGKDMKEVAKWSPYGTVKTILSASMDPATWNGEASMALLITIAYAAVFSYLGIKKFRWNTQ